MSFFAFVRRFHRLSAPGALLIALLQRTPVTEVVGEVDSAFVASRIGDVLRAVGATVASLGAIQSMAGATDLVSNPAADSTGFTASVGTPVSVVYGVTGTQTPPASWKINGSVPPGLSFSGLTGPGVVNVQNLTCTGTPTTAGSYALTITAYEGPNATLIASPNYAYAITIQGSSTTAPTFTTQPQSQSATVGSSVTFTAAATGSLTPTYQWKKDGTTISGATNASLALTNVQTSAAGTYTVVATNSAGSATSNGAVLTVVTTPVFTLQPVSQTVTAGASVTFAATVTGASTYQWQFNGANVAGATSSSLTLNNVTAANAGSYTLIATNTVGSTTSTPAFFTVSTDSPNGPAAWLSNLSVRANMAAGQTMIVGFTTAGGAENILVRAAGPGLAKAFPQFFGPNDVMADPRLAYYPSGANSASLTNDNWDASLATTFASVGAFPFDVGSTDAAFVQPIDGPNNTVWLQGTGAGTALVEGYALGGTNTPRLTNLSARNLVGTGANILIAGFVVKGSGTKKLLIRGIGPRLAELFGVTDALTDPLLQIYDSNNVLVAQNDNWDSSLAPTFTAVGAYAFSANSKDAAIVVNLPASGSGTSYTAQVSGVNGLTGEAVVEVYEVP